MFERDESGSKLLSFEQEPEQSGVRLRVRVIDVSMEAVGGISCCQRKASRKHGPVAIELDEFAGLPFLSGVRNGLIEFA